MRYAVRMLAMIASICMISALLTGTSWAASPAISLSPTSGPPGTTVVAKGTGWQGYSTVAIQIAKNNGNGNLDVLGRLTATVHAGSFTINVRIPATSGPVLVSGLLGNGGAVDATFTVIAINPCPTPQVYITPPSGRVGWRFLIKGAHWAPGGTVEISLPYGSKALLFPEAVKPRVGTGAAAGGWQTGVTVGKTPRGRYEIRLNEAAPQCPSKHLQKTIFFQIV